MMEDLIKGELGGFLQSNMPDLSLSELDEIAVDYIVSVLQQQLGDDESFDVEEFINVMTAYIPELGDINRENLCCWMLDLASKISHAKTGTSPSFHPLSEVTTPKEKYADRNRRSPETGTSNERRIHREEEQPDRDTDCHKAEAADHSEKVDSSFLDKMAALSEMFPDACSVEIEQCLLVTKGDAEETAGLLLSRAEHVHGEGPNLGDSRPKVHQPSSKRENSAPSDQRSAKNVILSRYGFVDVEADEKSHQPALPKEAPKKLVRYRDNQVVSTRGERFSLAKRDETDDMKRTYISLKPARKYRFH